MKTSINIKIIWLSTILTMGVLSGCSEQVQSQHPALSYGEFANVVASLSEPSAYFDSDNIISNEISYLHVIDKMADMGVKGGVYIGVGPDQNFTYIANIKPKYAFILDIRRDNLLEHLLFKAVMAQAATPRAYLSILFSKPIPPDTPAYENESIDALVSYFEGIDGNQAFFEANLVKLKQEIQKYEMPLTEDDWKKIEYLYTTFYQRHLELQWEYKSDGTRGISFISFRTFLLGKDKSGAYGNFLNSKDDYDFVRDLQAKNLIIPVTGDFAGRKALKAISTYIRDREDFVSAFYLSNVEYYLLPEGLMGAFAENVRRLPIRDNSILIRAYVNLRGRFHPERVESHLMTNVMQKIASFNQLFAEGAYKSYYDLGVLDYIQ